MLPSLVLYFFFFNDTATTEIYTLSLHDALPILTIPPVSVSQIAPPRARSTARVRQSCRSEEHTSELQSRLHLVCRLLLEKKKKNSCCSQPSTTVTNSPRPLYCTNVTYFSRCCST